MINNIKPNLFVVGAPKAATTSLHTYLAQHPDVFMSTLKEPNYFSSIARKGVTTETIDDEKEYLKLFFNSAKFKVRGESSTTYLYFKDVEKKIYKYNKNSKIIIILRDPVERSFSHYLMDKDILCQENQSVDRALLDKNYISANGFHGLNVNPYIWPSLYSNHIEKYLKTFGANNVKVLIYEELVSDWEKGLKSIFKYLNIDENCDIKNMEIKNKYRKVRYPKLKKMIPNKAILKKVFPKSLIDKILYDSTIKKKELTDSQKKIIYETHFKKEKEKLEILLERDLSIWIK